MVSTIELETLGTLHYLVLDQYSYLFPKDYEIQGIFCGAIDMDPGSIALVNDQRSRHRVSHSRATIYPPKVLRNHSSSLDRTMP